MYFVLVIYRFIFYAWRWAGREHCFMFLRFIVFHQVVELLPYRFVGYVMMLFSHDLLLDGYDMFTIAGVSSRSIVVCN